MFVAEFLICIAPSLCAIYQEIEPVFFNTEEVCLDHAEAKLRELPKPKGYSHAIVRCIKQGERI